MNTNTLPPTPNTLNPTQQREHQVWQLRIRCYSQFDIAEELGITQAAVSQILKRVRARLAAEFLSGAVDSIAEQAEQLMHIAKEALAAYQQSKAPARPIEAPPASHNQNTEEQSSDDNREEVEEPTKETKEKGPKPAFLRIALQALKALHTLRASFQPEQNPCDENVKMIVGIDLDHMKYKNGTPVQRAEVDRLIALQAG